MKLLQRKFWDGMGLLRNNNEYLMEEKTYQSLTNKITNHFRDKLDLRK